MNVKDALAKYFELQKAIHDHFNYREDWATIPLDDRTEMHWMLSQNADGRGDVFWSKVPFSVAMIRKGDDVYGGPIYTQRYLPRWVYPTETHTMISVDTQCDLNKYLMVFDNVRRLDDEELLNLCVAQWGQTAIMRAATRGAK